MGGMLRTKLVRLAAVAALVATQACGDGGGAQPAPLDDGNGGGDGDDEMDAGGTVTRDAGKDAGRDAGDAGPMLGPMIEVLSPLETDDPANENVISSGTVTVRCSVKKNPKGEIIDTKSVKVAIYSGDDAKPAVSQAATATPDVEVFQAENISLSALPNGAIRIECSAADSASKPQSSAASIFSLYDQGPKITFLTPTDKGFVASSQRATVQFRVDPQPLTDDDDGAKVDSVTATVGGKAVPAIDTSTMDDAIHNFVLDFTDTTFFTTVPKTLNIKVDASNKRAPKPRSVSSTIAVGVDSDGPTITVKSPVLVNNQAPVVSGKVDLLLEVKDALAGVNTESVQIQITDDAKTSMSYKATANGDGTYSVSFDTGAFPGKPGLTVTISAKDNVGIESKSSISFDVDTVPPWISLDPPNVREFTEKAAGDECSGSFDPLGDAVNEGVVIGDAYRVRALIWDRPLTVAGQTTAIYAMIDNTTPRLYIQHNASVPLLIDSDHDANHECDKVNVSVEQAPTTIVLSPVKPAGAPIPSGEWSPAVPHIWGEDMTADPNASGLCHSIQATFGSPEPISSDTTMTRVIKHTVVGNYEVVYASSPSASGLRSTGIDYFPPPGWACIVAAAKDTAGNYAFSPPMRVCAQRMGVTCESTPPPSLTCTDGCTIPAKFMRNAPDAMPRFLEYRTK